MAFEDNSFEVISAINKAVTGFLHEAGGEVVSRTKRNTRVDFGQVKSKWDYRIDKTTVIIGNTLENAIWEEFGTGQYAINGDGEKNPWYVPVDKYMGTKKPTFNGKVVVVYGKNGSRFYKTNGKKPSRAFQKAIDSVKSKLEKMAMQKFGAKLK